MENLKVLNKDQVSQEVKMTFEGFEKKIGMIPNLYAATANSGKALSALLALGQNLSGGEFSAKEIEVIALTVGQANNCDYCLSAHTALAKMNGFNEEETIRIRKGEIAEKKLSALVNLTKEITINRGRPRQAAIEDFFNAGYSKAALAELIGHVANNSFTNYINHIADTPIDFPQAPKL